jgi:hypothetical protein
MIAEQVVQAVVAVAPVQLAVMHWCLIRLEE